jgi:hypothetical protein
MARFNMTVFCMAALLAKQSARAFQNNVPATRVLSVLTPSSHSLIGIGKDHTHKYRHGGSAFHLWMSTSIDVDDLNAKIAAKGEEIRQLKVDGIEKAALGPHVEELLALKAQLPVDETVEVPKAKKKSPPPQKQKKKANDNNNKKVEEMSESELRLNRLSKVTAMKAAGVEPFEYSFECTRSAAQLAAEYEGRLEDGAEDEESDVSIAGRIMTRRVFGKLAFFTLQDETGIIQLQFDKTRLGDSFKVRN